MTTEHTTSPMQEAIEREERAHERRRRQLLTAATVLGIVAAVIALAIVLLGSQKDTASAAGRVATISGPAVEETDVLADEADAEPYPEVDEPIDVPEPSKATPKDAGAATRNAQVVRIGLGQYGYEPSVARVSKDRPVTLVVAKGVGCAAGFLIPELDVMADNTSGPATVELGKLEPGTYRFTCGMEMVEGTLIVS